MTDIKTLHQTQSFTKHRLEALTDGIFAVAMTLLVIELKIPESLNGANATQLSHQLLELIPRYISWLVSFFVLALFWYSSHRQMHFVRYVDGRLIALKILFLALVSFMPFTASLVGQFVYLFISQVFYGVVMFLIGCSSLLIGRYVYRHPELSSAPMPYAVYTAARFRTSGLLVIAVMSMVIAYHFTAMGNMAFLLMIPIGIIARRIEKRLATRATVAANEDKILSI